MDTDIVLLDLFSGIGGFSLGLSQAGFNITTHYYSEIDKHAIAIYKYQFKNSEYVGSVTTLDGKSITRPNIITFGSPCQDFSVAGKRAGMEGQRSSLIGEALRLITECRPDVFIWENVKGVFSSNSGADFWAIIQAFTNIGGYRIEWQLLNTAWFLPQNRERIYLIGHLTEKGGRLIFPIKENHRKDDVIQGATNKDSLVFVGGLNEHNRGDGSLSRDYKQQDRVYDADKSKEAATLASTMNSKYLNQSKIRRLTEIECERLQGFPDNWTEYGNYDDEIKKVAKTQRYKALGNAVTVKVVEEIGERLLKTDKS